MGMTQILRWLDKKKKIKYSLIKEISLTSIVKKINKNELL